MFSNELTYCSHCAVNDDFGGDTVIRQNLFFKSLLETSDHGWSNQATL